MRRFYFDHNATTPVDPRVSEAFVRAQESCFGNASSIHQEGQRARQLLEQSRRQLAEKFAEGGGNSIGANEIVFTSGGTEANNLAILGLLRGLPAGPKHIVTTAIEHPAVLETCRAVERDGVAGDVQVTCVQPSPNGAVSAPAIAAAIRNETALVSVMHANNETGVVQPLAEIASEIQKRRAAGQAICFHSDGVQAFGKLAIDVRALGVDLYSISAHKLYAPKGIGALWIGKKVPLKGIFFGGRHERERRAGTENVAGAAALAVAASLLDTAERHRLAGLRQLFEDRVCSTVTKVRVNGSEARLPNTSNLMFPGLSGESLVIALDLRGFAVSSGSACSSGSLDPSPALLAMGLTVDHARSSVRFSLGRGNDEAQVLELAKAVESIVIQMRSSRRPAKALATREVQEVSRGAY